MTVAILLSRAIIYRQAPVGIALPKMAPTAPPRRTAQTDLTSPQSLASKEERAAKPASSTDPLTGRERADSLQLIRNLQERVANLEAKFSAGAPPTAPDAKPEAPEVASGAPTFKRWLPGRVKAVGGI